MAGTGQRAGKAQARHVFCVDDNVLLVEIMARLFTNAGHRVSIAHDGAQAWAAMRTQLAEIDLVITDHEMPRMSGLELVLQLRLANFTGGIVVHSSSLNEALRHQYGELGVTRLVLKGSRPEELLLLLAS